jgi:hypothetical protein
MYKGCAGIVMFKSHLCFYLYAVITLFHVYFPLFVYSFHVHLAFILLLFADSHAKHSSLFLIYVAIIQWNLSLFSLATP